MSTNAKRVGWVGLGEIGSQMVKRLRAADVDVTVYARGAGLDDARAAGVKEVADYATLARASDVLFFCVYDDDQMKDVLFNQGAAAALRPGSIIVTHTTGSPATVREIADRAPEGVSVADACFSGGPADAAAGQLTLMVGGDADVVEEVTPLLRHYAAQLHHAGALGHGQKLKLLNNLLFATNLMNAAEALALCDQQGFNATLAAQVLGASSGASYALGVLAGSTALAERMQGIRPYLQKDVAACIRTADEAGLDIARFLPVADYFGVAR